MLRGLPQIFNVLPINAPRALQELVDLKPTP